MKTFRRGILVLVIAVVVVAGIGYFTLDRILKSTVEKNGTASLRLKTTLSTARLGLFGGKLNLNGLRIASPQGFSAPDMLEMRDVDLAVDYSQLRKDPIHVRSLTLDQPKFLIEQSGGALNFKKAADRMPPGDSSSKEPIKLVIDDLKIQDAEVVIRPGLPGMREEIVTKVPSLALRNLGSGRGSQNGAAIKDVAMVVMAALAAGAAKSDSVPPEVRALLQLNAGLVAGKLGAEVQKQIAAAIPGEIGKKISNIAADPGALTKDPGKAIGDVLGGKSNDSPPAGRSGAPTRR